MSESISKVTISDIARELNITAATVSRALNDHPAIKETTKKAVRDIAVKLNYQPNKLASSLRLGKSNIIGVIIPSAEINFFGSVVHGIEKVANENNYNVLIYQTNEMYEFEKKGVQTFLRSQVDGVLASISKDTIVGAEGVLEPVVADVADVSVGAAAAEVAAVGRSVPLARLVRVRQWIGRIGRRSEVGHADGVVERDVPAHDHEAAAAVGVERVAPGRRPLAGDDVALDAQTV